MEVEAEDVKSPESRRKMAHRWRSETAAAAVAAHGVASQSEGIARARGGGGMSVTCECAGEAWQKCGGVRMRVRWRWWRGG